MPTGQFNLDNPSMEALFLSDFKLWQVIIKNNYHTFFNK